MKKFVLFISVIFCVNFTILAQENNPLKKVIQFSGIVTEGDSLFGVPGAAIISLKSGTGANTNMMGYFSLPVFEGDSILIAAFGYKKRYLTIPIDSGHSYSVMIELQNDTILLPEIVLRRFPSEEVFKEVLLSMDLDDKVEYSNMKANLNDQIMARLMIKADVPPSISFRYYMDKQASAMQTKYVVTMNPLTNPFAWARFLQEVQYQKKRKEELEKEKKSNRSY
jgi:hypothetical protein